MKSRGFEKTVEAEVNNTGKKKRRMPSLLRYSLVIRKKLAKIPWAGKEKGVLKVSKNLT